MAGSRRVILSLVVLYVLMLPFERLDQTGFVLVLLLGVLHLAVCLRDRTFPLPRGRLTFPLVALVGASAVAGLQSVQPSYSASYGLETFGAPAILYCVVLKHIRAGEADPRSLWIRSVGCPVIGALGLCLVYGFATITNHQGAANDLRFHGGRYWYAETARFLEVALFLTVGVSLWFRGQGHKWLFRAGTAVFALGVVALLATKTKGAWVGFFVGTVAFAFLCRQWVLPALLGAIGVVALILVPGFRAELDKFTDFSRFTEASSTAPFRYRPHGWRFVLDRVGERPWLGHGPGGKLFRAHMIEEGFSIAEVGDATLIAYRGGEERARSIPVADHAHNVLLQAYYEMGVVGVLLFLWLFTRFFLALGRSLVGNPRAGGFLMAASGAAVVAILVHGLVSHVYSDSTFSLLILGMVLADCEVKQPEAVV